VADAPAVGEQARKGSTCDRERNEIPCRIRVDTFERGRGSRRNIDDDLGPRNSIDLRQRAQVGRGQDRCRLPLRDSGSCPSPGRGSKHNEGLAPRNARSINSNAHRVWTPIAVHVSAQEPSSGETRVGQNVIAIATRVS
jgi:hypothetical protein